MGTTLDDVKLTLDRIEAGMGDLLNRLVIDGSHIQTTHLSDINQSMGLILAGEFRTGQGQPGYGFSGVRMAWPPMTYNADTWNVVGVNNDVMQFGLSANDGKAYAGAGAVVLDSGGVTIKSWDSSSDPGISTAQALKFLDYITSPTSPTLSAYIVNQYNGSYWETSFIGTHIGNHHSFIGSSSSDGNEAKLILAASSFDGPLLTQTSIILHNDQGDGEGWIQFNGDVTGMNGWQLDLSTWTYASATSFTVSGNVAYKFPVGTKIKITQTTDKYFIINSASYSFPNTTVTVHGFGTYTIANATIDGPMYSYEKIPQGWPFGNGDWTMLTSPLTSTAWDGDAYSTTAKTLIDLSTVFGVPAGVQAVLVRMISRDSGSYASTTAYLGLSPNGVSTQTAVVRPAGVVDDAYVEQTAVVPCDSNGDIYYQISATGVGTMDCWIEIHGYLGSGAQWNSVTTSTFGSSPNYAMFDTDGTLTLHGTATAYDDLRLSGSSARVGVTAPSLDAFGPSGSLRTLRFENGHHDEIYFEIQMPHAWKEGSNIYPHVHWTPVSATAGNVVWQLDYTWANVNGTFGAPTTMTSDATAAGGTAWVHKLSVLKDGSSNAYISGSGKTLSSMLVCRLHRDAGAGSDTLAADVAFLEFDLHYEIDSLGSKEEYIK